MNNKFAKRLDVDIQELSIRESVAIENCKEGITFKFKCPVCDEVKKDFMRSVLWARSVSHIEKHLLKVKEVTE